MSEREEAIKNWAKTAGQNTRWAYAYLHNCLQLAETSADREFWETQLAVLEDVQTAIEEHINPKNETK